MGFKTSGLNWTEIDAAGTSRMIPAGGYIAMITGVEDVESREYLRFTYDIADGEYSGFFASDNRVYTHQFIRSYTAKAAPFMKQFLVAVEESNPGFSLATWDNDPAKLVGLLVGVVIQREDYTNNDGEDRARMNVVAWCSADDIRQKRFKLPEPVDKRERQQDTSGRIASAYDADVPFI